MHNTLLLLIVVVVALAFDFTNGFHDTANAVATVIYLGYRAFQGITWVVHHV